MTGRNVISPTRKGSGEKKKREGSNDARRGELDGENEDVSEWKEVRRFIQERKKLIKKRNNK